MTTRTFKAAAATLGAALALPAFATVANAEPTDPDLLAEVSAYLVEQIDDDTDLVVGQWGVDHGLSIDILLALVATGADPDQVAATTAAMAEQREAYTGEANRETEERYAGSFAKLTLGLLAGGTSTDAEIIDDLLDNLRDLTTGSGRISDVSNWGDYSSVITQSLAVLAFTAVGEPLPDATVRFLVEDQCDAGGFTNRFGDDTSTCEGDPDATSFAIQALLAAQAQCSDLDEALADAQAFLAATQNEDGVWVSDDLDPEGDPVANANSTGLASQAFTALGLDTDEPRAFLASLQDPDSGGLRYQESDDEADARASAQALPALAEAPFFDVVTGAPASAAPDAEPCLAADDGGNTDGGNTDGGNTDGGNTDGGDTDGGDTDGGDTDGGNTDGGNTDVEDTSTDVDEVVTSVPDTTVAGEASDDAIGPLARTGSDHVGGLLTAGLVALLAGIGMTLVDRRRRGVA